MRITDPNLIDDETIVYTMKDYATFTLSCSDEGMLWWFRGKFKCKKPFFKQTDAEKSGVVPNEIHYFNPITHEFPIGLFKKSLKVIDDYGYKYFINFDTKHIHDYDLTRQELSDFAYEVMQSVEGWEYEERDYQLNSVYQALKGKRGLIESSVGSGKSWVIYIIIRFLLEKRNQDGERRIILCVPTTALVEQMVSDFHQYGWDVYKNVELLYSGKNPTFKMPVLVTTWQSIYKRPISFYDNYGALLFDESHIAKSDSVLGICKSSGNCEYRLGFTGTMPPDKLDEMNLKAWIGDVLDQVKSKFLQDIGVLSQLKIIIYRLVYPKWVNRQIIMGEYSDEVSYLSKCSERTELIVADIIGNYIKDTENTLILFNNLDHIDRFESIIKKHFPDRKIRHIQGKVKTTIREESRKAVEDEGGTIILATYHTASTGMNIKRLHHIIFAYPYKSKIKIIQSLGRVLRTHGTKAFAYLWDITDDMRQGNGDWINHSMRHSGKRKGYYRKEQFPFKEMVRELNIEEVDDEQ